MRNLCLTCLAIAAIAMTISPARALTLHEDVAYWYTDGEQILTIFDPSTDWLAENIPTGRVLVKVQQTVYDPISTLSILKRNGDGENHPGFLYAYSVTNLNVGDPDDLSDMGITEFVVSWDPAPAYVTVARHAPLGWLVDTPAPQPAWKWTSATAPGILPGHTVGGFWAVGHTGFDREVDAQVLHIGGIQSHTVTGKTTGPIPETPTILALATGLAGLGVLRRSRGA